MITNYNNGKKKTLKLTFYKFFLDGVAGKHHLNQRDGIHPNRAGVAVIVQRIFPKVLAILNGTKP